MASLSERWVTSDGEILVSWANGKEIVKIERIDKQNNISNNFWNLFIANVLTQRNNLSNKKLSLYQQKLVLHKKKYQKKYFSFYYLFLAEIAHTVYFIN